MKEPKIRFNEFKGEWNSSAIGDIATFSKGRGYSKSDLKAKGNPIILYGRMYTDYSFVIDSVETYATLQKGSVLSDGNEVVIPASGETPEDIAVASAVTMKNVILGGDLNILKFDKNKILSTFAAMQISCGRTRKELSNFAQGKTVVHLHNSNISKGHFCYPPIAEQHSIASFFTTLDAQISASTSRLASLKQIKAASLQAMFPQEGETVPKLRFKGFEGEWEKVKLGEILTYEQPTKYLIANTEYKKNGTPVLTAGKTFILGYTSETSGIYTNLPVIIFDDFTTESKFVNFQFKAKSSAMKMLKPVSDLEIDINFAYEILKNIRFRVENHQRHWLSVFSKITVMLPSFAEQRAIASYFTNLDRQITLQSQRLEKLKQIKAACLDKMFV